MTVRVRVVTKVASVGILGPLGQARHLTARLSQSQLPHFSSLFESLFGLRSKSIFMDHISGKFGRELVQDYAKQLHTFRALRIPELAQDFFISLEAMSEKWRRFILLTCCFPFETFKLADLDHESFLVMYSEFQQRQELCRQCIDSEFTGAILRYIVRSTDETDVDGIPVKEKFPTSNKCFRTSCALHQYPQM